MATYKELSEAVDNYQSHGDIAGAVPVGTEQVPAQDSETPEYIPAYKRIAANKGNIGGFRYESEIGSALNTDWGHSRYDARTGYSPGMNIEDARAHEQPWYWKIGNGIAKMGVTTATTAANTVGGTVYGIGSALFDIQKQIVDNIKNNTGYDFMKTLDAGMNNRLSEYLMKVQSGAEDVFPNYRTEEEQSEEYQRQWIRHIGTPNFIGDMLLKNFGFTLGAIGGGMFWTKLIGKGLSAKLTSDLLKAATVAGDGDAEAIALLKKAAQAIPTGRQITVDANAFVGDLKKAAQRINSANQQLQLYGSVIGALGEASMEGLMAKQEFLDSELPQLQQRYAEGLEQVRQDVMNLDPRAYPDYFNIITVIDENGVPTTKKLLTEAGEEAVARRQRWLTSSYEDKVKYAEELGERLATHVGILNTIVLTPSNTIQFGRAFSGGFRTARSTQRLRGTMGKYRGILDGMSEKTASRVLGAARAAKVAGTEAAEEMTQGFISSGLRGSANNFMTQFNDDGYDDENVGRLREWYSNALPEGWAYLSDVKNWQEGFLGAVTGLFGIPSRHISNWHGGIPEAIRSAREDITSSRNAAQKLNAIVKSDDFQKRWRSYIRHLKYDDEMADALLEEDKKKWKDAEMKQIISDVMSFADAGRLDDLRTTVDNIMKSEASDDKAAEFRDMMDGQDPSTQTITKNKTSEEVVNDVKDNAKKIQDAIDNYSQVYEALQSIAPTDVSDKQFEEMVFTAMNIKAIEARYLDMLGKVRGATEADFAAVETKRGVSEDNLRAIITDDVQTLEQAFSMQLPVNNNDLARKTGKSIVKNLRMALGTENATMNEYLDSMEKLSDDRYNLYDKLNKLLIMPAEKFEEQAKSEEKQQEKANQEAASEELSGYQSFKDVKDAYYNIRGEGTSERREQFLKEMRESKGANEFADRFVEVYDTAQAFKAKAREKFADFYSGKSITDRQAARTIYEKMVSDLILNGAETMEDLQKLDPKLFASVPKMAEYVRNLNKAVDFIADSKVAELMAEAQKNLRTIMAEFMKERNIVDVATSDKEIKVKTEKPKEAAVPTPSEGDFVEGDTGDDSGSVVIDEDEDNKDRNSLDEVPPVNDDPAVGHAEDAEREDVKQGKSPVQYIPDNPKDDSAQTVSSGMKTYLHTAIPEIALGRMALIQAAIENRGAIGSRAVVLADIPFIPMGEDTGVDEEGKPFVFNDKVKEGEVNNYSNTYRGLVAENAFDNMSKVKKGTKIKFVIKDSFPKAPDGSYQILMCMEDELGNLKVLNILGNNTKKVKYYGLTSLRAAIDKEYEAFDKSSGKDFVFSKSTTVWTVRNGVVDYFPSKTQEKPINEYEMTYDPDAPIILVHAGTDGTEMVSLLNNNKKKAEDIFGADPDLGGRVGHLYYLANGSNGYNVPIRLGIEHFNESNMNNEGDLFESVRKAADKIADVAHKAVKARDKAMGVDEVSVIRPFIQQMRPFLKDIDDAIDIHKDVFTFGFDPESDRLMLKIIPESDLPEEQNIAVGRRTTTPILIDAENLTGEDIVKAIAGLNRSFNISTNMSQAAIRDRVKAGILTANAVELRPKGIDFYTFPWFANPEEEGGGHFAPYRGQQEVIKEETSVPAPENTSEAPADTAEKDDVTSSLDDMEFQITGAGPSSVSAETRKAVEAARKSHGTKMAKVQSALYKELMSVNSISNMNMNEDKLKAKLKRLGVSSPVIKFLTEGIKANPELRNMRPYDAFVQLASAMSYDLVKEYNKSIRSKVDDGLNAFLINYLKPYHITIKNADLQEMFGDNVAGAFNVLEKTIWLANNPERMNEMTMPEEFAHAFIELMGSSKEYGSSSETFKYLYDTVVNTDMYAQVYEKYKDVYTDEGGNPDEYRIRKEAIGQALATAIVHNWNEKATGKKEENKGFWGQLRAWFEEIVNLFKGKNAPINFEGLIDDISKDVLAGNTDRLNYVDSSGFNLLDYERTLEEQNKLDGGKAVAFMQWFSSIGNVITGSLAYRRQGTVYRSKRDSLHDIDMIVPQEVHGLNNIEILSKYNFKTRGNVDFRNDILNSDYFKKVMQKYPKMKFAGVFNSGRYITVNAVYSENEALSDRFCSMIGSHASRLEKFTEEERRQMYLFDFFIRPPETRETVLDEKNGITLVDYKVPMREKLKMGRAKDIYDYQMWRNFNEVATSASTPHDLMFQVTTVDPSQKAVELHYDKVADMLSGEGIAAEDIEPVSLASVIVAGKGPSVVNNVEFTLASWNSPDTTFGQEVNDFADVFNSIFTIQDKEAIEEAMVNVYGKKAEDIDAYDILTGYTYWKLTDVIPSASKQHQGILKNAYQRMLAVENNREAVQSNLLAVNDVVDCRREFKGDMTLGKHIDTSTFDGLPLQIQKDLLASGWTKDAYNSASEIIQDKALRCVGVL